MKESLDANMDADIDVKMYISDMKLFVCWPGWRQRSYGMQNPNG